MSKPYRNKKIIFTVTNDLSYDQRMIRICNSLIINGFEVVLVGKIKRSSIPLDKRSFQQVRLNTWFSKGKLFYLIFNLRLFFYLLRNRFDIIGSVDLDTLLPCFLVSKIKGKPCVFDAHEYFTEVPEVINRPLTKWGWETLGNWIIPQLKYAYTVSESLQKLFSKKYGIPFGLIRNITHSNQEPTTLKIHNTKSPNHQKTILLYQGVLNEGRGLEAIIKAIPHIKNVELWLAGEGDLSDTLRKLVNQLQLDNRIKFLGYLSPEKLKLVTTKATIGLNLLENRGLSYYYSLANKTFDYLHEGVPAIHSQFPEYQRINEKFEIAVLVKNLEVATLVTAVNSLLNNKEYYQQLKNNCRLAKKVFNWEKEEMKLIDFYNLISRVF